MASLLLIFTNFQHSELPLLGLFFLVIGHTLWAHLRARSEGESGMMSLVLGAAVLFAGLPVCSAVVSLVDARWVMTHSALAAPHFEAPALRQFVPVKDETNYSVRE